MSTGDDEEWFLRAQRTPRDGWYETLRVPSPFAPGTIDPYGGTVTTTSTTLLTEPKLTDLEAARAEIVSALAAARTAKNAALIDVWTSAYDALNHAAICIAQAREAQGAAP